MSGHTGRITPLRNKWPDKEADRLNENEDEALSTAVPVMTIREGVGELTLPMGRHRLVLFEFVEYPPASANAQAQQAQPVREYLQITVVNDIGVSGKEPTQKILRLGPNDQQRLLGVLLRKWAPEGREGGRE